MASTGVVDIFLVYQFLRRLATPFEKWEAFKTGVIDKEGKNIGSTYHIIHGSIKKYYEAEIKNQRITPQKVRNIENEIRGSMVGKALDKLTFSTKKSSKLVKKVLEAAISNAENNFGLDIDTLKIIAIFVDKHSQMLTSLHPIQLLSTFSCYNNHIILYCTKYEKYENRI